MLRLYVHGALGITNSWSDITLCRSHDAITVDAFTVQIIWDDFIVDHCGEFTRETIKK